MAILDSNCPPRSTEAVFSVAILDSKGGCVAILDSSEAILDSNVAILDSKIAF
ncbi:hypothetical protein GCM10011325_47220 [Dyadobacter sediminis]|nr:hypothetical protein GCM10011325_47220 [Dyadobacter sediminis]